MRTCLISEGEGVGAIDRRVWHKRTFPGAMDVRPTHSPTLRKWTSGLGVRHLAMQNNEHECTKCKNIFIKNILNIMVLPTKNLKYTVGMDIVTNHKHKTNH